MGRMTAVDTRTLLRRLAYGGSLEPDRATLGALQHAFLESVPFENLDIHLGHRISLAPEDVYDKIVHRRRGGFCYECNTLFARLLVALGYSVEYLSARMATRGRLGPEFDHMVLLVRLDRDYLVDVGNGASVRDPMPLSEVPLSEVPLSDGEVSRVPEGLEYRVRPHEDGWGLFFREAGGDWLPRFLFTTTPRQVDEYLGMCEHHQTSPESSFTRHRLVTLALPGGRLRLLDRQLTAWEGSEQHEQELATEADVTACYRDRFGLVLE